MACCCARNGKEGNLGLGGVASREKTIDTVGKDAAHPDLQAVQRASGAPWRKDAAPLTTSFQK